MAKGNNNEFNDTSIGLPIPPSREGRGIRRHTWPRPAASTFSASDFNVALGDRSLSLREMILSNRAPRRPPQEPRRVQAAIQTALAFPLFPEDNHRRVSDAADTINVIDQALAALGDDQDDMSS